LGNLFYPAPLNNGNFSKIESFEEQAMETLISQLSRSFFIFISLSLICFLASNSVLAQISDIGLVATPDSHATQIALEILEQSGNAIDAGVAAMFALSVVQPYASGMGGGGFMLIQMTQDKQPIIVDFREQAPKNTNPSIFYQDNEIFNIYTKYGYRSICVPGMVAGVEKALKSHGTMTFKQILQPTIDLATSGFIVSEALANLITENYDLLESNRATSFIFLPDWYPLKQGQIVKRDDLALTFSLLTIHGPKVFYHDEIATGMFDELTSHNGLIQLEDLKVYQPMVKQPIRGKFQNLEILSTPPPSSGGTSLIELLMILEKFDLNKLSINSGPYIHLVVEVMKQVFEDRERYFMGDPEFDSINPQIVLSDNHIQKCFHQIDSMNVRSTSNEKIPGTHQESHNASHISIVDRDGNAISVSYTLNSLFGSAVTIPKYGILLNNAMNNFSSDSSNSNSLKPGKRPQTTLTPTILLKNQKPYLVLGGSGAERIISMLAQIIINIVNFRMSLEDAVHAPRFHYNYYDNVIEMETRIEANAIDYLKKLGHKINLRKDFDIYFGSAQVILIDPSNHIASSVNDVRQPGQVYFK